MSAKHTPGPWHTGTTESTKYTIYSRLGYCIANSFNGVFVDAACEANARRIAACVNACEGFSIEELDGANLFQDSIKSAKVIDDLLEALQLCLKAFRHETYHADTIRMDAEDAAVSAIAKAEGGAA